MPAVASPILAVKPNAGGSFVRFLRLIRFSHTIFALPFAFGSLLVAARGRPSVRVAGLVLLCMIFARTAAMLFNRLADWSIDQRNPRTASRHQLVTRRGATIMLVVSSLAFLATAALLNRTTAWLAPVALGLIFVYSMTKRFTDASHFFLGLSLAIAPSGAWIAQTGALAWPPLILSAGVVCWVAGFDLIYATQDYEFDRREKLRSLVVRLGITRSLRLEQALHLAMFAALILFGWSANLHRVYFLGMPLVAAALFYEHRCARQLDLLAINRAFFQSNAFVSTVFLISVAVAVWS
jgi:4-hydroxybenzoate polyprenyltransferase